MESGHRTPPLHRHLDTISGGLLLFMTVWAPWAFGCTVSWAIWTMCGAGYALGLLLMAKWHLRWREDYRPSRWVTYGSAGRWAVGGLVALTVLLLGYVLVSWWNARATVEFGKRGAEIIYQAREPIAWLPTTYDAPRTIRGFWRYLALALTFWAARDWLLTKTRRERHSEQPVAFPPARFRLLLWTLFLSSSLLALVSIAQRLDGTDKLLWTIKPLLSNTASFSWGPYAYRTNGAQYFNLVWPVSLGFWWVLRGESARKQGAARRFGGDASMVLLPGTILMAACPLVATSRGGTLILLVLLAASLVVLALAPKAGGKISRIVAAGVFLLVLALGWFLGGEALQTRFSTVFEDKLSNRTEVWEAADRMAEDAGWLGTGAETFTGLYSLYRTNPDDTWNAFAHNDWIETRITLGRLGFGAVIVMLLLVPAIWSSGRGLQPPREFTLLLVLSLGGVLAHARFDFPFQMFSLVFLFLLLLALGMSTAGREARITEQAPAGAGGRNEGRRRRTDGGEP